MKTFRKFCCSRIFQVMDESASGVFQGPDVRKITFFQTYYVQQFGRKFYIFQVVNLRFKFVQVSLEVFKQEKRILNIRQFPLNFRYCYPKKLLSHFYSCGSTNCGLRPAIPLKSRPSKSAPVIMRFSLSQHKIRSLSITSSSECSG